MSFLPPTLVSIFSLGITASALAADSVNWNRQAEKDAQEDFSTIIFDGLKTWPYRRVLVPESCDKGGRINYPDGFLGRNGEFLNFAFDDNRHRCVFYRAKLPPLTSVPQSAKNDADRLPEQQAGT